MKRLVYPIASLSILLFACNISKIDTPSVATVPQVVSEPPVVTVPPVVTESLEVTTSPVVTISPVTTNLTCSELSLFLDPALASGYTCETIPESTEGMEIYPQYTNLTLQGYVLSEKFFEPHISVFPVQRYNALIADLIPSRISELQALTGGGIAGDPLPFLPTFNAVQIFHAQVLALPFVSGGGIRYLTEYAQYYAPVNNTDLFYTYQGLTSDGTYWVSAILPINNPILPADAINPPGGMSWEAFNNNIEPYITDMVNQLNSQPSGSYTPNLATLDALVSSITIQP